MHYYRMSSCGQQVPAAYGPGVVYSSPVAHEYASPPSCTMMEANSSNMPTVVYADTADQGLSYMPSDGQAFQAPICSGESMSHKTAFSSKSKCSFSIKGNDEKMNSKNSMSDGKGVALPHKSNENVVSSNENLQNNKDEKPGREGEKYEDNKRGKEKGSEGEDSGNDHMDVGSDGDSGCPSECADLSPCMNTDNDLVPLSNASASGTTEPSKPRGKRRYYMYGNHKLIKPIKEIPIRFQMLLAETSAAKARCEGQPIYMQQQPQLQQPAYDVIYYQTTDGAQNQQSQTLNANASCFVPSPNGDCGTTTFVPEDYTAIYPVSNYANHGSSMNAGASLQHAPLFVPPPAAQMINHAPQSSTAQPGPTIIMYSNTSSSTCTQSSQVLAPAQALSMPPPFPPPSSIPPPTLESPQMSYAHTIPTIKAAFSVSATHCPSSVVYTNSEVKNAPSKPLSLNIPPPANGAHAKPLACNVTTPTANPSVPPPNACLLPLPANPYMPTNHLSASNNLHAPLTSTLVPTSHVPHSSVPGNTASTMHVPSASTSTACASYPSNSGNQYMYMYPSNPTGPPSNPPQGAVMYMVSPAFSTPTYPSQAFQQQGLVMPSVAAQ